MWLAILKTLSGILYRIRAIRLPSHSRHSPSFPDRWSKGRRLGSYCVVVLSQQIRTDKKTNTIK